MRWSVLATTILLVVCGCLGQDTSEAPGFPWDRYQDARNPDYRDPQNRGQNDFNRGQSDFNRGQTDFNRGQSDFNQGQTDFNRGQNDFNRGQNDFNRGQSDYNRDTSRENVYNGGFNYRPNGGPSDSVILKEA